MLFLPSRWESAFLGSAEKDFELHDYLTNATESVELLVAVVLLGGCAGVALKFLVIECHPIRGHQLVGVRRV